MGVLRWTLGLCAVLCVHEAAAYKLFQKKIPNGANVPGVQALGHDRDGGGPNNDFGQDFIAAMFQWTKDFCEKDSDGDGQTNGQELGDPCCEFEHRKHEVVRWTQGVSHPGDPERKSDPALWADVVCGAAEPEAAAEAKAVEPRPEGTEEVEEKEETVELAAEQQQELTAGAPALQSSVMLSAVALTAVVVYFVVLRTGRRYSRNLPIFRQRRGAPV
ncbi:hypothetical protein PR003_g6593 [Phytophthora rubi]|uniref:Temptin Cys/Cys disulfide domain-containing protein n=1 Tax=Phytophthora rubi TaxID=129364 RepID=A0A6A3N8A5_9STRA|nr:hypothetical protein PR002_g6605 [Phytophthora rubi]KAE9041720.1 hypothetical protein PR001_g6496 [Phytophthora rubi]KAE9348078.1 hypothetical protein PR003_g6593 [Phytophthora rubi]